MNAERAWWRHATCQPYFERAAGEEEQWRGRRARVRGCLIYHENAATANGL